MDETEHDGSFSFFQDLMSCQGLERAPLAQVSPPARCWLPASLLPPRTCPHLPWCQQAPGSSTPRFSLVDVIENIELQPENLNAEGNSVLWKDDLRGHGCQIETVDFTAGRPHGTETKGRGEFYLIILFNF